MDLEKEISKAMADPQIMNKVADVISSLGNNEENKEKDGNAPSPENGLGNILGSISGAANDERMRLLMAIKPFLSEKRAPYMDSAVTILKLISVGKIGKDLKLF